MSTFLLPLNELTDGMLQDAELLILVDHSQEAKWESCKIEHAGAGYASLHCVVRVMQANAEMLMPGSLGDVLSKYNAQNEKAQIEGIKSMFISGDMTLHVDLHEGSEPSVAMAYFEDPHVYDVAVEGDIDDKHLIKLEELIVNEITGRPVIECITVENQAMNK